LIHKINDINEKKEDDDIYKPSEGDFNSSDEYDSEPEKKRKRTKKVKSEVTNMQVDQIEILPKEEQASTRKSIDKLEQITALIETQKQTRDKDHSTESTPTKPFTEQTILSTVQTIPSTVQPIQVVQGVQKAIEKEKLKTQTYRTYRTITILKSHTLKTSRNL